MNDWPEWERKNIFLARKESSTRPFLQKVLNELEENMNFNIQMVLSPFACALFIIVKNLMK